MARFPDSELERLKATTDLAALVRGAGVELQAHGEDLLGLCPFHDDHEPSLVVSPKKGLWNCLGACRAGGSAIDWVMKANQLTFREAVVHLQNGASSATKAAAKERSRAPLSQAARPSNPDLLARVVATYRESYRASADAKGYTAARGIGSEEAAERFAYGYADGRLLARLGREHLSELVRLGLVNARTNRELLAGCLVLPIVDPAGKVLNLYGRRLVDTAGSPRHLYLPGPRRGVFNPEGLKSANDLILCEALIDALTFWCHGFRNVTASYGVNGFTDDLRQAILAARPERLLLAYDRDAAGDAAADDLAKKLGQEGIGCYRVLFPKGMDANSYSLHVAPPEKSLALVLQSAEWIAGPQVKVDREHPELEVSLPKGKAAAKERSEEPASVSSLAALQSVPETTAAPGVDPFDLTLGERRWKVRGLLKNLSYEKLQVLVRVESAGSVFVDAVDLVSSRQREGLRAAGGRRARSRGGDRAEGSREDPPGARAAAGRADQEGALAEGSGAGGRAGGRARSAGFLASSGSRRARSSPTSSAAASWARRRTSSWATSPRSRGSSRSRSRVIVQSSSAAGKSSLMDAVLAFVPEEERVKYSAMTGQSLFYMGETDLKHKVLAIVEEEGAERASYALKLLQSEGELTIASTGKDPETGQARDAGVPRRGPGDDLPHDDGDRGRRGAAQPLHRADGRRGPRADARDPRAAARAADARGPARASRSASRS